MALPGSCQPRSKPDVYVLRWNEEDNLEWSAPKQRCTVYVVYADDVLQCDAYDEFPTGHLQGHVQQVPYDEVQECLTKATYVGKAKAKAKKFYVRDAVLRMKQTPEENNSGGTWQTWVETLLERLGVFPAGDAGATNRDVCSKRLPKSLRATTSDEVVPPPSVPDVYVQFRPIGRCRKLSSSSDSPAFKHWVVYFLFGNGHVIQCDGYNHHLTGKLMGSITELTEDSIKGLRDRMVHLGKVESGICTEDSIRQTVSEINRNSEKYHLLSNNCQLWAKMLLGRFGVDLTEKDIEHTIKKCKAFGALFRRQQTESAV